MLKIVYQNGEVRILKPTPSFYSKKKPSRNEEVISIEQKVKSLVDCFGKNPYQYTLTDNGVELLNVTVSSNTPHTNSQREISDEDLVTEKLLKKQLGNKFKRTPFETKIIFSSGPLVQINMVPTIA